MTLHLFQISSNVYPLLINEHLIGQKTQHFFKKSNGEQGQKELLSES
jgi:hypothetical protein